MKASSKKPTIERIVIDDARARYRLMRALPPRRLMMVQRTQSPLGPIFLLELGLLKAGEKAA